jgi:DNA primase
MSDSNAIFQTIRDAVRIEDIIGEHIALKRSGKELVGLCPFHNDRRPSMYVSPQKQIFSCFVCASAGDVFRFVQNYHKMTPGEALRYLAGKAGVTLPELPSRKGADTTTPRQRLYAVNEWAMEHFRQCLLSPAGAAAMSYLQSRGLTPETITNFRLGLAPDGWTRLTDAATRKGHTREELIQAGLAKARTDGNVFDVFRNRIIFPICDATGRVVAFGGRVIPVPAPRTADAAAGVGGEEGPKYLNSAETPIFMKRKALYGLDVARQEMIRTKTAVVVEGYMDVIACHQTGATNVVATLGTSLTAEHARLLGRFIENVVLTFDNDEAGRRAADRALEVFIREPVEVKIAGVPDGKDPCDYCMSHGREAFKQVVDQAREALEFQWEILSRAFRATDSLVQKEQAATAMLRMVAMAMHGTTMDVLRRGLFINRVAGLIGISAEDVARSLKKISAALPQASSAGAAALEDHSPPGAPIQAEVRDARLRAQQWVIGVLLTDFALYAPVRDAMTLDLFAAGSVRKLAEELMEYVDGAIDLGRCSLGEFVGMLGDGPLPAMAIEFQREAALGGNLKEKLMGALDRLKEYAQADVATETAAASAESFSDLLSERRRRMTPHEGKKAE